jgi:hypothetical protein
MRRCADLLIDRGELQEWFEDRKIVNEKRKKLSSRSRGKDDTIKESIEKL